MRTACDNVTLGEEETQQLHTCYSWLADVGTVHLVATQGTIVFFPW